MNGADASAAVRCRVDAAADSLRLLGAGTSRWRAVRPPFGRPTSRSWRRRRWTWAAPRLRRKDEAVPTFRLAADSAGPGGVRSLGCVAAFPDVTRAGPGLGPHRLLPSHRPPGVVAGGRWPTVLSVALVAGGRRHPGRHRRRRSSRPRDSRTSSSPDYAKLTVVGVIIACVAWPIVTRMSSAPRWLFFRLAILVTLVLWLPDLYILYMGIGQGGGGADGHAPGHRRGHLQPARHAHRPRFAPAPRPSWVTPPVAGAAHAGYAGPRCVRSPRRDGVDRRQHVGARAPRCRPPRWP